MLRSRWKRLGDAPQLRGQRIVPAHSERTWGKENEELEKISLPSLLNAGVGGTGGGKLQGNSGVLLNLHGKEGTKLVYPRMGFVCLPCSRRGMEKRRAPHFVWGTHRRKKFSRKEGGGEIAYGSHREDKSNPDREDVGRLIWERISNVGSQGGWSGSPPGIFLETV